MGYNDQEIIGIDEWEASPQDLTVMMAAQDQFNRDYAEAHRRPSAYDPFGAVADRFGTVFQRLDDAEGNA
jgi:hypothetical protein